MMFTGRAGRPFYADMVAGTQGFDHAVPARVGDGDLERTVCRHGVAIEADVEGDARALLHPDPRRLGLGIRRRRRIEIGGAEDGLRGMARMTDGREVQAGPRET